MDKYFWSGIVLLIISVFQIFVPEEFTSGRWITLFWAAFKIGIILIGESLTIRIQNKSLISVIIQSRRNIFGFVVASILGAIMLDGVAQWLGNLWIYPFWNHTIYAVLFVPGFALYWLTIVESYLGTKAVVENIFKGKKAPTGEEYFRYEKYFYKILGVLGPIMLIASLYSIINQYQLQGGFAIDVVSELDYNISFLYILGLFIGLFFIFEYIEYWEKKTSIMKDILHKFYPPLIAIFLTCLWLAPAMELLNLHHLYWEYVNWPFQEFQALGLPVTMLLAWPLHYIAFLSLYRVLTDKQSSEIWR